MFNPGAIAMDDGGRCLLDVINDPLLLQSFLEDKSEESAKELGTLSSAALENVFLGHQQQQDHVTSTTTNLLLRQSPDSMGFGFDKSLNIAAGDSSPRVAVSSTVPLPPNGQQHPSPHSTAPSPVPPGGSRPHSASPLPPPHTPSPGAWSPQTPGPSPRSCQSTPAPTSKVSTQPVPRSTVVQIVSSAGTSVRTTSAGVAAPPRIIQPKQPQLLPKPAGGNLPPPTQTAPPPRATTKPPQPAPPPNTVQRAPSVGMGAAPAAPSPLLIGQPGQPTGVFPAGAQGTFLLNQYIPGIGQSPILIQGSLGQIQGVQLALRPQATGLTLQSPQGHKPHGQPTFVIPQNLGTRPNIILAPRMVSSPLSFAIAPGQPLTLQQLQAMLPAQHMLAAQPTLGTFAQHADQQPIMHIPAFTQPQMLTQDHHHHHHVTQQTLLPAQPQVSAPTVVVSQPVTVQQPTMTPQPVSTPSERPKPPSVNLAELLKEHGIMPESDSTPPPSPTTIQDSVQVEVNQTSHNCTAVPAQPLQVVATPDTKISKDSTSKSTLITTSTVTTTAAPPRQAQLSLAHDGSVILRQPEPAQSELQPASASGPASTVLSRTHSALLERLSAAPPVNVPDLATLTAASRPQAIPTPIVAPQHLTIHGMNNGLVTAQTLASPHSFVTVQGPGVAVANVLCHGPATSSAQVNHVVVRHAPLGGHACHSQMVTASSALPMTPMSSISTSVMAPTVKMVMATAPQPVVVTSPAVFTTTQAPMVQASPVRSTTPATVTVVSPPTTANNVVRHTCPKHGGMPLNSQNQLLYEQLQTQIANLCAIKKPSLQQKLLLQQMLSVEEKLRDSAKVHVTSSATEPAAPAVTATTAATIQRTHSPKPVTVHAKKHQMNPQNMAVKTTVVTVSPALPTPVAAAVTVPVQKQPCGRAQGETVVHKVNHVDTKLVSVAKCTTTTTACSTQPIVSSPLVNAGKVNAAPHPLRVIAPAPSTSAVVTAAPAVPCTSNTTTLSCTSSSSSSSSTSSTFRSTVPLTTTATPTMAALPPRPLSAIPPHLRVANQMVKLSPQQQHHLHHHHHHHQHQPRSQTVVLRVQHPANHVVSPPAGTGMKQIMVQVPGVVSKQVVSKNNNASAKASAVALPGKVEAAGPLNQVVEQPKACPIKPKVPDRYQKLHMFHQHLSEDQNCTLRPDAKVPFASKRDACQRLLRYHVYNTRLPREEDLNKSDEIFAEVSERLLEERRRLYEKFQYLMLLESMREYPTAEKIMVEKLFIQHENEALAQERKAAEEARFEELPTIDPWPTKSPVPVEIPEFHNSRTFKKEPPDHWFDDGIDLEPAAKRRSVKDDVEEIDHQHHHHHHHHHAPPDDDLMSSIRKELEMSPSDEEEFVAGDLADFEPPVVRFTSPESKRTLASAAASAVDWTTKASGLPKAPELDLSGIAGLDDDEDEDEDSRASSAGGLGLGGFSGSRVTFVDDDDVDVGGELHNQVQSAINSILDFRSGGDLGCDRGNRGESMDYETADDDTPTDSALDEAVRSILL
ncbi:mucin-2-like isoform X2 [Ornithodoros turicata]|uniref:mucin-2-like isoform X2 n=1 Tax=Ornithodoros turicata TaxID=34597 RepID=UPI003138D82F